MVIVDASKFLSKAEEVNSKLGRLFASSLDPLLRVLGSGSAVALDDNKVQRIQELICHVPADRLLKYSAAFDVLKDAGFAICGRPSNPSMHFIRFDTGAYAYVGLDERGADKLVVLEPGSLHHVFDFHWKSSNGSLQTLEKVATREFVKFRTSQRSPPFNDTMPTDMQFFWGESESASSGFGRDDHSTKPPSLICRFPVEKAGEVVAEQWYQYSLDGKRSWHNIPGAAYLLVKGVRKSKAGWVFFFRKCNWEPHNTKKFCFEVEYPLQALAVPAKPNQKWARNNGTPSDIKKFGRVISLH